jgi:hypothetical protein
VIKSLRLSRVFEIGRGDVIFLFSVALERMSAKSRAHAKQVEAELQELQLREYKRKEAKRERKREVAQVLAAMALICMLGFIVFNILAAAAAGPRARSY